ncbi:MAG: LysM peptidoglycan-binding domain-containing protein [Saprospiraceae bacterium]|nr:LysM peptidoglycan-binding domain-containing protein [Saprospiraceae bacterium]
MQRLIFVLPLLFLYLGLKAQNATYFQYIEQYRNIAISEMERAGIPASIKLAQALLESNAGRSTLARQANNHFGIKCGGNWNGKKHYRKDDDYDHKGRLTKSCFRSYKNAEESFVAHSEFLRDPNKDARYGFLFRLKPTDYKKWAYGLKRAGYATNPNYPKQLINIIETYELDKLDKISSTELIAGNNTNQSGFGVLLNNDVKMVLAKKAETPAIIARRVDVDVRNILKYNEGITSPNQILEESSRVYLQPKRSSYREQKKYHYVKQGETMYTISQMYGVKMDKLYSRNRLAKGKQPAIGEKIKLRGWKVPGNEIPKLQSEVPPPSNDPVELPAPKTEDPDVEADQFLEEINIPEKNPTPPTPPQPSQKPDSSQDAQPEKTTIQYHTVSKGDTLYNISKRYGITVERLKSMNKMQSDTIHLGQRLKVSE